MWGKNWQSIPWKLCEPLLEVEWFLVFHNIIVYFCCYRKCLAKSIPLNSENVEHIFPCYIAFLMAKEIVPNPRSFLVENFNCFFRCVANVFISNMTKTLETGRVWEATQVYGKCSKELLCLLILDNMMVYVFNYFINVSIWYHRKVDVMYNYSI